MRRELALLGCLAIVLLSASARADAASCSQHVEEGKQARANAQLREARSHFVACSSEECPAEVVRECATWAAEVITETPTILVQAKDDTGADLADVVVSVDDTVIAQRIDGKAIAIDPGPHTLRFQHKGFAPESRSIVARPGQKAIAIDVTFTHREGSPLLRRGLVSSAATGNGSHTIYPYFVTATGVVAVIFGAILIATAPSLPAGCERAREQCAELPSDRVKDDPRTPAQENAELEDRRHEASRSEDQPVAGAVIMGAGGLLIVGGLLWYFLETPERPQTTARFRPVVGARESAIFATF